MTLHEKYTKFLRTKIEGLEKTDVYDYACEKDFNDLWQLSPSATNHKVPAHIIIVWESTYGADANSLLVSHLTPMDWALAFSVKIPVGKSIPFVYIVDLTGKVHDEWAMQPKQRSELLKNMPWVRLYASLTPPQVPAREGYEPIFGKDTSLIKDEKINLSQNNRLQKVEDDEQVKIELPEELKSNSSRFRSGDHHDINNLIGPALFIRDGVYGALARRVCLDDPKGQEVSKAPSFKKIKDAPEQLQPLRIIVVDDYVDKGWGPAFCSYFGIELSRVSEDNLISKDESIELQCFADPMDLIKKLSYTQKNWNFSFFNEDFFYIDLKKLNNIKDEETVRKLLQNPNDASSIFIFDKEFFERCIQPYKKNDVDCSAEFKKILVGYGQNHNCPACNYGLRQGSRLWMISGKEKAQEILFFDLRLFPRQESHISIEEKKYFGDICARANALAKHVRDIANKILFPKGEREIECLEGKIEKNKERIENREAWDKSIGKLNRRIEKFKQKMEKIKFKKKMEKIKFRQKIEKIKGWFETERMGDEIAEHPNALALLPEVVAAIGPTDPIIQQSDQIDPEEKEYLNRVRDLVDALVHLMEKVPSPKEIQEIEEWLDKEPNAETSEHYKALTLLPRILSAIDPSYPIILFSATGRRDIMETVKPYKNIITSFEKPNLDTLSSASKIQASLDIFEDTLRESLKIIRAREHCQKLQEHGPWVPEQHTGNLLNEEEQETNGEESENLEYHIELFIDETGIGGKGELPWRVGGCFALFSGEGVEKAQEKADAFDDELVRAGVIYTEYQQRAGAGKTPKGKETGCADALRELSSTGVSKPDKIGLVSIQGTEVFSGSENANSQNSFSHYDNGDRAFFGPLEILTEGFLYEGLPQIAASIGKDPKDISVSILPATRKNVKKDNPEQFKKAREYEYASGTQYEQIPGDSKEDPQIAASIGKDPKDISVSIFPATRKNVKKDNSEQFKKDPQISQHSLSQEHFAPIVQRMVEQRKPRNIVRALAVPLTSIEGRNNSPEELIKFLCRSCKTRFSIKEMLELLDGRNGLYTGKKIFWKHNQESRKAFYRIHAEDFLPFQGVPWVVEFIGEDFALPDTPDQELSAEDMERQFKERLNNYTQNNQRQLPWKWEEKILTTVAPGTERECQCGTNLRLTKQGAWQNKNLENYMWFQCGCKLKFATVEQLDEHMPNGLRGLWTGNGIMWQSNGSDRREFCDIRLQDYLGTVLDGIDVPSIVAFKEGFDLPDTQNLDAKELKRQFRERLNNYTQNNQRQLPWKWEEKILTTVAPGTEHEHQCDTNLYLKRSAGWQTHKPGKCMWFQCGCELKFATVKPLDEHMPNGLRGLWTGNGIMWQSNGGNDRGFCGIRLQDYLGTVLDGIDVPSIVAFKEGFDLPDTQNLSPKDLQKRLEQEFRTTLRGYIRAKPALLPPWEQPEPITCLCCTEPLNDPLVLDVRALHYVADQILTECFSRFCCCISIISMDGVDAAPENLQDTAGGLWVVKCRDENGFNPPSVSDSADSQIRQFSRSLNNYTKKNPRQLPWEQVAAVQCLNTKCSGFLHQPNPDQKKRVPEDEIKFLCPEPDCEKKFSAKEILNSRDEESKLKLTNGSYGLCINNRIDNGINSTLWVWLLEDQGGGIEQHNYTVFDKPEVGEFVDVVDNDLIKIMHLSKQIDIGGSVLAKAIADFPLPTTETGAKFGPESKAANKPSLRKIAAQRAASKLPSLSQDNFFIIVDDLEQKRQLEE